MFKLIPYRCKNRCASLAAAGAVAVGALTGGCGKQEMPKADRETEARELYERANDYVTRINEGAYSYEYINFHYQQAMKNIDRVLTAYPDTQEAAKLRRGELKLGKYGVDYFRNTLLVQLGDMKEATETQINCAIYLHNLPEASREASRGALALILETLCRTVRTDEALIFPALPEDQRLKMETIVRVVSREVQQGTALSLVQGAEPDVQPDLAAAYGQGVASSGMKPLYLEEFAARYPTPDKRVEVGIFKGMIDREDLIYRDVFDKIKKKREEDALKALRAAGKEPEKPKEPPVRYDVAAYFRDKFGANPPAEAAVAYAGFLALQGKLDDARAVAGGAGEPALVNVVQNYYEHLILNDRLTGRETLHRELGLTPDGVARCEARLIELLAQNARYAEADALKADATTEFPNFHDQFIRSRIRGVFYSRAELFYLTAKTITDLDIKDPAVCAEVLLDWYLSPNQLLKGSAWGADQILFKYFSMQKEGRAVSRKLKKS
jgi:hypothetical protein